VFVRRSGRELSPEILRGHDWNDFKVDQIVPMARLGTQRFWVGRFHDLETARPSRIHPTRVVDDAFRQHSAAPLETLAD
jgi:hypothetical protein